MPAAERSGGRYTVETIKSDLDIGNLQLFVAVENGEVFAACTTQIAEYPNAIWLCVVHCGGSRLEEWLKLGYGVIEDWARDNGCIGVEIFGRKEWARALDMEIIEYRMEKRI